MAGKVSDGKTIDVVAPAGGVVKGRLYRISGFNGVAEVDAAAGATFALNIDPTAIFSILTPAAYAPAVGDVGYLPPASPQTGSTALTATATGNTAAVKVVTVPDANDYADVRLLNVS